MSETTRIVIMGKTGTGKSSFSNTVFGKNEFAVNHTANSGTSKCEAKATSINGRTVTWVDTPGFFDTSRSPEEMKEEILRCINECAPGPHVFIIVLKVEKYTEQEKESIKKVQQYFAEEALKYSTLLFTHGDQLPEGQTIEKFVNECKDLSELAKKCGGRFNVIDNKYWKNKQEDKYRTNQFQVEELFKTIDKIIEANQGKHYTNEMLQEQERQIQQEEDHIKQSSPNMSQEEITQKAKTGVFVKQMIKYAGVTTGALLGAFLGGAGKLMEGGGATVALAVGVAVGTAAGIAAGKDITSGAAAEVQTPSDSTFVTSAEQTAEEHQG